MTDEKELIIPTIGQGDVQQAEKDRTFEGRLDAFNEQTEALKILGSEDRWKTDWNRNLQTNVFGRGPLSPESPLLDDFSNTMETVTGIDPTDPKDIAMETLGYLQEARNIGPIATVAKRAVVNNADEIPFIKQGLTEARRKLDNWFSARRTKVQTPDGQTFYQATGEPSPPPAWRRTVGPAERNILLDAFADEVITSPKGVNIAKRKEGGYRFLGDFAAEWNEWSKSIQFIDELADKPATAYVEHLVGKGNRLDFFWRIPDDIRFRKGSRHSPNNVRILYSDRFKKLKDATENILYKQQANTPDMNRLVVDLDIPKMRGKSITVRQAPRDLVIKRVDGTVVGRLGDYHDVLYARTPILEKALTTNINPKTGKVYIDPNTKDIKKAIRAWRENILREKINFIINEAPTLKDYKTKKAKFNYQESAIQQDLVNFLEEYKFIPLAEGSTLKRQLLSEPAFGLRGGKPIQTPPPRWSKKLRDKKGPFPSKTSERKIQEGKLKGTLDLEDIFPDKHR